MDIHYRTSPMKTVSLSMDELSTLLPSEYELNLIRDIYTGKVKCVKDIEPNPNSESDDIIAILFDMTLFIRVRKGLLSLTPGGNLIGEKYMSLMQ